MRTLPDVGRDPMSQATAVHVVRKGDLITGLERNWDDPYEISPLTPEKRAALLANPLSQDDGDPVQLIGTRGRLVVGRMDLLVGQFHLRQEVIPTLWTSAYYVPEDFRTTLIGVMLIRELQRLSPTVSVCGVSQMALPVFKKLKWSHFRLPRHVIVLRSRPVVERWLGTHTGTAALSKMVDVPLRLQRALWGASTDRRLAGLRCERVPRMGPELDEDLRAMADGKVHPHRSAAWINWLLEHRFNDDPSVRKALYYVSERRRRVVGYFILKSRFHPTASQHGFRSLTLGSLGDWMILDPACLRLEQIVLLAVRALMQWNPDAIELCLESKKTLTWLRRWGFPRVGELNILVRAASKSLLRAAHLREQTAWRLRPAEGDNLFS